MLALQALVHDAHGDDNAARTALEGAIGLAKSSGFIRVFLDLGPRMAVLLERLRARGVAREYLDDILRAAPMTQQVSRSTTVPAQGLLTKRETEILECLAQRLSNKEIALELFVAPVTVKRHTSNIYEKLGVKGRREAVAEAIALKLLPPG